MTGISVERRAELRALAGDTIECALARRAVLTAHCWTNEDGRQFVFADDLRQALDGPVGHDGDGEQR